MTAAIVANTDTTGGVTVATGGTDITLRPNNAVTIGTGVKAKAYGNLTLSAGKQADLWDDRYDLSARTDTFAGSAIPIQSITAKIDLNQANTITVRSDAVLETGGDAVFAANRDSGNTRADAKAKGTSWATKGAAVIDSLLGGQPEAVQAGDASTKSIGRVIMDGTVVTGIISDIEIVLEQLVLKQGTASYLPGDERQIIVASTPGQTTLTGTIYLGGVAIDANGNFVTDGRATKSFTLSQDTGGATTFLTAPRLPITIAMGTEVQRSGLIDAFNDAMAKRTESARDINQYNFYNNEMERIAGILVAQDVITRISRKDGKIVGIETKLNTAQVITIGSFTAGAGRISVSADALTGKGAFRAKESGNVEITNKGSATLRIGGITMPESAGGLSFNGTIVSLANQDSAKSAIETINKKSAGEDNFVTGFVEFKEIASGGKFSDAPASTITIKNTLGKTLDDLRNEVPAPH
ncbi:hypothetical protein [Methylorubrum aminovorans]|uniref:hypothetical protein n=1 Tax=Methylorubrum aminovorans TaxID=269069 RepID=UPI0024E14DA3|nr:hypothetical protein [Methylorubrum aminovorans]